MKLRIELDGRTHDLSLEREGRLLSGSLDGRPFSADSVEVAPGVYSILLEGASFEIQVETSAAGLTVTANGRRLPAQVIDPRQWRGRRSGSAEAEGSQRIIAPMPGKVVRLLVAQGEEVAAGKGLLVVEAMKMQNEIRSPKTGRVEKLAVTEGQPVNAGDILAIVS